VLVEVKARFDEQNNIEWAQVLENAGVHVTYGLVGLKTHAKALLVVRREQGRPRAYVHIGTGNYHSGNARVYTDLGLLTCDPVIGADVINLFHFLTGHAPAQPYRELIVAPAHMRRAFLELAAAPERVIIP
jgi:polyphosphate kinase